MKTTLKILWRLISVLCVLLVLGAAVFAVVLRRKGVLTPERLDTMRDVLAGKEVHTEMPTEGTLGEALAELESKQARYDDQTMAREEALNELAISMKRDQEALRQAEDKLKKDIAAFEKVRDEWTARRAPKELDEAAARRRDVFKQLRDMAPAAIVDVLVTYDDADLKQMLKLFKADAADLIPLLRQHPEMQKKIGETTATRFDLFWQEYNKPEPIPNTE